MDERTSNPESLIARIKQVEHERDELRKDIEQLCMQQAGPSYLVVATRMHFQRTAGLEQEIENLKKKLAGCTRDSLNLQEELSEVYRIKSQLADLHSAEVSKNKEAEKQVKFFQSCMAAAFAERDHSLMETEKAIEQEEAMSCRLNDFQKRVEELTADCLEEKKLNIVLNNELTKLKDQAADFEKVIDKFYKIRQHAAGHIEDRSREDKSACLLHDPDEMWNFDAGRETSSSICSIPFEEVEILKNSVVTLQNQLRMGLECEELLRNKVCALEEKRILSEERIRNGLSMLRHFHIQNKREVMGLLLEEKIEIHSMFDEAQKKIRELQVSEDTGYEAPQRDDKCYDLECRDVHISNGVNAREMAKGNSFASSSVGNVRVDDTSSAFAQALQEKVAALLLLSQQEERHLLEKDVYAALEKKLGEHQKNLVQVTNEKVKALMELAQLKQEYQLLQESISDGTKQGNFLSNIGEKLISAQEKDGKIKNLLKRTYLKGWIGRLDRENQASLVRNNDERSSTNKTLNYAADLARLKVENATLQESMANMEHLTSTIHKLRLSLVKARDSATLSDPDNKVIKAVDNIIAEANNVKTALSSSLPVSWSAEADAASGNTNLEELTEQSGDSVNEKLDYVSAAGFELVELLLMAAQLHKDKLIVRCSSRGS